LGKERLKTGVALLWARREPKPEKRGLNLNRSGKKKVSAFDLKPERGMTKETLTSETEKAWWSVR